jgi:hypothetical protein
MPNLFPLDEENVRFMGGSNVSSDFFDQSPTHFTGRKVVKKARKNKMSRGMAVKVIQKHVKAMLIRNQFYKVVKEAKRQELIQKCSYKSTKYGLCHLNVFYKPKKKTIEVVLRTVIGMTNLL